MSLVLRPSFKTPWTAFSKASASLSRSNEYFNAVDPKALSLKVVSPVFLENKDGKSKTISFYAKKARGAMARFIIEQKVANIDGLKDFDTGGYKFQNEESSDDRMIFTRDYSA